jgi:hypothetical protein
MSMSISWSMSMRGVTAVRLTMGVVAVVAGGGRVRVIGAGSVGLVRIIGSVGVVCCLTHTIGPATYSAIWCCAVSAVRACSVAHGTVATVCTVAIVALGCGSHVEGTAVGQHALLTGPRARVIRVLVSRTRLSPVGLHGDCRMDVGLGLMKSEMRLRNREERRKRRRTC